MVYINLTLLTTKWQKRHVRTPSTYLTDDCIKSWLKVLCLLEDVAGIYKSRYCQQISFKAQTNNVSAAGDFTFKNHTQRRVNIGFVRVYFRQWINPHA